MSALATCPSCRAPLSPRATAGLCPKCVMAAMFEDSPDESAPARLSEYDLLEPLGHGGMGTVWRARQRSANRDVALKTVVAHGPAAERRFRAEIEAAARLDHPGIVPVYEVGEADGRLFFTMRLLRGGTLAERDTPEPREAAALVAKLARAVAYAHERGVLHRDLKPANVLLDDAGEPHIADFGLARMLDADASLSVSGQIVGTPQYMAPEQASGGTATTATDVHGLGAILYALLAGRAPFEGKSTVEVLRRVVEEEARFISTSNAQRPTLNVECGETRDLEIIALKCLAKDPARRYASAAALAEDIDRWLRGEPIAARPATSGERLRAWARRHRALAASLAVGVAALGAFIFLQWRHGHALAGERDSARGERDAATLARARAERSEAALAENLYAADMQLAWNAYDARDLGTARRIVERVMQSGTGFQPVKETEAASETPQAGKPAPPFDARLLARLCEGSQERVIGGLPGAAASVAWLENENLLLVAGDGWVAKLDPAKPDARAERLFFWPILSWGEKDARDAAARLMGPGWPAGFGPQPTTPGEWLHSTNPDMLQTSRAIAASADGAVLALTNAGRWTRAWNAKTGRILGVAPRANGTAAVSADGRVLAIGAHAFTNDAGAFVMNPAAPGVAWFPPESGGNVALSRDGATLLTGAWNDRARVWLVSEKRMLHEIPLGEWASAVALAPDASFGAAAGAISRVVKLFVPGTGKPVRELSGHKGRIHTLAFSPDGNWLASAGADQTVRLWSTRDAALDSELRGHTADVLSVVFSADSRRVFSASADGTLREWKVGAATDAPLISIAVGDIHRHQYFISPDGKWAASAQWTGRVRLTRIADDAREEIAGLGGSVEGWLRDGTLVTSAMDDAEGGITLEWRDCATREIHRSVALAESTGRHACRRLSPDGALLAEGTHDGALRVWDTASGALRFASKAPTSTFGTLAWSPDGARLAASIYTDAVLMFDAVTGAEVFRIKPPGYTRWMEFSPDGALLAVSDFRRNEIALHDARTGALRGTLAGHTEYVFQAVFSPDGRTLASVSHDQSVRLWHTATLRPLAVLDARSTDKIAFSPDGTLLLTGAPGARARVWRAGAPSNQ